jgi:hypothetical protein
MFIYFKINKLQEDHECLVYFFHKETQHLQTFGTEKALVFADQVPELEKKFVDFVGS